TALVRGGQLRKSGTNDSAVWQLGWGEIAENLKGQPITVEALRPQYFRDQPCRLSGRYVMPLAPGFEYDVGIVLRRLFFDEFLGGYQSIVEFGSGTGINLLLLATQFPGTRLSGCDWATPSRDILLEMGQQQNRPIGAHIFNMLIAEGWDGAPIDRGSAVLTVHAMEQLDDKWRPFLHYLLARQPGLVLHIEPIFDFYDESPFDRIAASYHLERKYLKGYYSYLRELENSGKIEIVAARRVAFGGFYHDANSVLAWRPKL
ncbi:MAG: class I SAM-dependent methyltransferase, partial [Rhodospirillaceae bacterium]|nr:class I SAM-dependent methyltransferase [Rhodospirillaceae bacterium]